MTQARQTVGVVGLGEIGGGVARQLLAKDFDLRVFDLSQKALEAFSNSAQISASVSELADGAKVVIIAVVNEAQLTEVLHGEQGLLAAKAPARSVVVLSTVSVEALATHARELEKSGIALVDCGVSGGPSAAGEGQLVAMVGGSEEGVAAVGSVLEAFSQLVLHMGPAGSGMAAKIARNLVQYASWAGAFEAQRLAEACGVPLSKLAEAIRVSDQKIGGAATLMFRDTVAPWPADTHPGLLEAMD
ncbi:MAG: NAD(P)-binding domain-containing protein, partial [Actinomycetes bacterium]